VDIEGSPLSPAAKRRIADLAIPPAWEQVWICPDDRGHLQAVGTDSAGRRQYLYHPEWRRKRDSLKYDRTMELGRRLPRVRAILNGELDGDPSDRAVVIAVAIRLIDLGCFRPGAEQYTKDNGSFGLTTLEVRHVDRRGDDRVFHFVGKAGVDQEIVVSDRAVTRTLDALTRRRRGDQPLLLPRRVATGGGGRGSVPVDAGEINGRIRDLFGLDISAKDFRTWKATVVMARELADGEPAGSPSGRKQQITRAVKVVADLLGNTPSVARASYIDPRVIDLFNDGRTIGAVRTENGLDRAVVRLLAD
jgi:DNA topoisomerase-1